MELDLTKNYFEPFWPLQFCDVNRAGLSAHCRKLQSHVHSNRYANADANDDPDRPEKKSWE